MGEEVRMTNYDGGYGGGSGGGEEDRTFEWEDGLPSSFDLTPLSQLLISPELASAFRISPEPSRSVMEVNRASENTMSSLRDGGGGSGSGSGNFPGSSAVENDLALECSDSRKVRKITEEDFVAGMEEAESRDDDSSNATKTVKRTRLVWTPQLHKRFIEVVAHLGITNAVPKTIMQLMNVEGLTRENVASHLQKYRLYLKRQHDGPGPSPAPPSSSTSSVPQSLQQSGGHGQHHTNTGHYGMLYPPSQMMSMPMMGMGAHNGFHGYDMVHQRDWSGNNFGSVAQYRHLPRNDKCQ